MNISKFTQKSIQAVQDLEKVAYEYGNQEVEQEHLLYALLSEPELMPPISSHTLRHTGCTRLGENNVNPKVMQYVMGHSDAQITMNVYNHIAEKSHVENEMSKMNLPETVPAVV